MGTRVPFTSRVKNFDGIEEGDSQESCYIAPTVRITEAAIINGVISRICADN